MFTVSSRAKSIYGEERLRFSNISKGYLPAYAQKSAHPYTTSKSCYIDLLQSLRVSDSPLFLKELA
jgi:hypothetical protein